MQHSPLIGAAYAANGAAGAGDKWTMLHHMSSTEYLNYESGKFSKSRGIGVFGTDAMETGIPADVWRFYIFYNRPEKADALFTWKDFQEKVNGELIGNLGNLVNRTMSFITRYYDGKLPAGTPDPVLWETVQKAEASIAGKLERAELRDAFREIFELSSYANKYFQDAEPWRLRKDNPPKAGSVIRDLAHVVRDLAVLIEPYMPQAASRIGSFFGLKIEEISWKGIGKPQGIKADVLTSEVLFAKLEDELVDKLRERYSGSQKERQMEAENTVVEKKPEFCAIMDLRVAKIEKIEKHPNANKLYVIGLETGEGSTGIREERTIVSGLVGFYTEEQLLGRRIIVAYNLAPAKLRGVESRGMLLAAGDKKGIGAEGQAVERVEVIDAGDLPTGTRLLAEGAEAVPAKETIDIDTFLSMAITVKDYAVRFGEKNLCLDGKPVRTKVIPDGEVH